MSINRYDIEPYEFCGGSFAEERQSDYGEYVRYEDHIKIVDSYITEIASLKAEVFKLMSSLETWDEEFK